jgi:hypothetical protein
MREIRLLVTNLFQGTHDTAQRVHVHGWLVNLQLDVFQLIHELLKHALGFLVEVHGIPVLPLLDPLGKALLS